MKQQSDLHQLIQSLSRTEKRYFTMDAQKSGRRSSRYLELFRALNKMETFDESALQEKFGSSLATDKHYLYEAILRSMRDYRSSKSRAAQVKEMMLDANFLYQRGLYQQSEERLRQAKSLAAELDDQISLLEITREQLNYVWTMKQKDFSEQIRRLLEEKDRYIHNINEELGYLALAYQIQMAKDKLKPGDKTARQLPFSESDFAEAQLPEAAHAQRRFLQSGALYYDMQSDFEKANHYYRRMVDWWDTYPNIKAEEYVRYLADLFNLLHASYYQKKYQQFKNILDKISQEQPANYHDQQLIFKQLTNYQLLYHINLGVTEGYEDLLQRVSHGMSAYKLNPVSQLIMAFNVTVLLFILGKYKACQEWSDQVLRTYNRNVDSSQFRLSTLLISLLAAYQTDELDLFDSTARALRRAIRSAREGVPTTFFTLCLQHCRKLNYAPQTERRELLNTFTAELRELLREKAQLPPLGMDDLVFNWLESCRKRKALATVFREQAAN